MVDPRDRLARSERPALEPPHRDLPDVVVVGRRRHEQLRGGVARDIRRRYPLDDGVEERLERRADVPVVGAGGAGERVRIDRLELRLLLLRAELDEQIERLVEDVVRPGFGTVDLVDDDDRAVAAAQCLPEDELRLRHRAVDRVDEQEHAVHHVHHALDLTAEIGVTGRVDDVDLDPAIRDRDVLRHDRDAALALERVGVEHPLRDLLVVAEDTALSEHRVHERRLAVVDVGDDRDVPDVGALHRPLNVAFRLFTNASTPSFLSSVAKRR